jgi:uncharacterized membrane protein (DUF106 family)
MHMTDNESSENKRRYAWYRHHAWAGTILLSVVLAIHYFIDIDQILILPIVTVLIIYIIVALVFTYRYSAELTRGEKTEYRTLTEELKKAQLQAEIEKEQLKVEKKRIKAEQKSQKKTKKE